MEDKEDCLYCTVGEQKSNMNIQSKLIFNYQLCSVKSIGINTHENMLNSSIHISFVMLNFLVFPSLRAVNRQVKSMPVQGNHIILC